MEIKCISITYSTLRGLTLGGQLEIVANAKTVSRLFLKRSN
jgi:hypothetical protein